MDPVTQPPPPGLFFMTLIGGVQLLSNPLTPRGPYFMALIGGLRLLGNPSGEILFFMSMGSSYSWGGYKYILYMHTGASVTSR